ncbi:MAG: TraX family protein [Lachnospiraceae bacterium]|nr:TraX family protein [Lachnospiraceae bacterium]
MATAGPASRGLNRDMIKMVAMLTMLVNHAASALLPEGTLLQEILRDIGYFTAPVMCCFLVEGYRYTRSLKAYGTRLLIFAVLSQLPYQLALSPGGLWDFRGFNMMVSLLLCLLIIVINKQVADRHARLVLIILCIVLGCYCDWSISAALYVLLFLYYENDAAGRLKAFSFGAAIIFVEHTLMKWDVLVTAGRQAAAMSLSQEAAPGLLTYLPEALLSGIGAAIMPLLAGFVMVSAYNGQRAACSPRMRQVLKWGFYIFYPAHLLVLGLMRFAA